MTAFHGLIPGSYGAILADPPWNFASGDERNPRQHYDCMDLADIARLPVRSLAAPNCALAMWCTWPMLANGIAVMEAWGFHYKTGEPWAKQSPSGNGWAFGTGYIFRNASEVVLIGTIGKPEIQSRSVRGLIVAPVREHSRKPGDLHDQVEALWRGPYAELFARAKRPGWDAWGNQVGMFAEANDAKPFEASE